MPLKEPNEGPDLNKELKDLVREEELKEGEAVAMRGFCDNLKFLIDHGFSRELTLEEAENRLKEMSVPALQSCAETIRTLLEHYNDVKPRGFSPDLTLQRAVQHLELNAIARENPEMYEKYGEMRAEIETAKHFEDLAHALEALYKTWNMGPQTTLGEAGEKLSNTISDFDSIDKIRNAKEFSEAKAAIKELLHSEATPLEHITPATALEETVAELLRLAFWLRDRHEQEK